MKRASMLLVVLMLCGAPAAAEEVPAAVLTAAANLIPGTMPDRVNATPMPGMYQVTFGPQVVYLFADGRYLLHGDLIDLDTAANLTEEARQTGRRSAIEGLDEAGMVVFSPTVRNTPWCFLGRTPCREVPFGMCLAGLCLLAIPVRFPLPLVKVHLCLWTTCLRHPS